MTNPDDKSTSPMADPDDQSMSPMEDPDDQSTSPMEDPDDQSTSPMADPARGEMGGDVLGVCQEQANNVVGREEVGEAPHLIVRVPADSVTQITSGEEEWSNLRPLYVARPASIVADEIWA